MNKANSEPSRRIARKLLEINGVSISHNKPFIWSSGIKAPIYCDHRLIISYPEIRNLVIDSMIQEILRCFGHPSVVAGVGTAGIPYAAWVSDKIQVPMVYIRPRAKSYGRERQIEGVLSSGDNVVIVEDVFSTGASSLLAARLIRESRAHILGAMSIFSFNLTDLSKNFQFYNLRFCSLYDFATLIEEAIEINHFCDEDVNLLNRWRANPRDFYNGTANDSFTRQKGGGSLG